MGLSLLQGKDASGKKRKILFLSLKISQGIDAQRFKVLQEHILLTKHPLKHLLSSRAGGAFSLKRQRVNTCSVSAFHVCCPSPEATRTVMGVAEFHDETLCRNDA